MNFTTIFCPQCGMPTLHECVMPMCTDGWEVLFISCECCDYDVIKGFRRVRNIPDDDGYLSVIFAKPLDLGSLGESD